MPCSSNSEETYAIWLPFELPEGKDFQNLDPPCEVEISGYKCILKKWMHFHILVVKGLPSQEAAQALVPRLGTGLLWAAIECGLGLKFNLDVKPVHYYADPDEAAKRLSKQGVPVSGPVHGIFEGYHTVIYPDNKNIKTLMTGRPGLTESSNPQNFSSAANEGIALFAADAIVSNPKLKMALDLYCLAHFQESAHARFLTLWTALEVLAPPITIPVSTVALIDRWIAETREAAEANPSNDAEVLALQSLAERLGNLRTESITQSLKAFVRDALAQDNRDDASDLAAKVARLYSKRSRLIHQGDLDLQDSVTRLDNIVRQTLQAVMRRLPPEGK